MKVDVWPSRLRTTTQPPLRGLFKLTGPFALNRDYPVVEAFLYVLDRFIIDKIELANVKMQFAFVQLFLVAHPDYSSSQTLHHTSFEIDSVPLSGEIGNHETCPPNLANDFIVDPIDMRVLVDPE